MRTLLVTGSDTGVGKTWVVAALARLLSGQSGRVQIVKVVETGRAGIGAPAGDAETAATLAGVAVDTFTLAAYPAPIAPAAAARAGGQQVSFDQLASGVRALPPCDWRILEGAGGIATPIDDAARDWADFARAVEVDAIVVVVPDRLGAINQARLAFARVVTTQRPAGIWLNAVASPDSVVAASTRDGLRAAGVPIWAEQGHESLAPVDGSAVLKRLELACASANAASRGDSRSASGGRKFLNVGERCQAVLDERDAASLRRTVRVTTRTPGVLDLASNDYLGLSRDAAVAEAVAAAARTFGTSAAASPLVTGWTRVHQDLTDRLVAWHRFGCGLLWSSGFAANSAVLGGLPQRGDLVLADRLVHASMIAGLLRSGARLQRYDHLDLDRLEPLLAASAAREGRVFVVTESVFSMDGDYPDLSRLAALKRRHGFCWIVDEAHATGWYGPEGAGLVRTAGVERDVDVLVGTFGKALGSGGAYALFHDVAVRDYLVNTAGEFIYSTALPPTTVAAAAAALERVAELAAFQSDWHRMSREFRHRLRSEGWQAPDGDSPIVPVALSDAAAVVDLADALRDDGVLAAAVRPPTVPSGTSRLRLSLTRSFGPSDADRVLRGMSTWRSRR